MRNDNEIQKDILMEFRWDPSLADEDIALGVHEGVVTLGGFATSYADKLAAERLAGRIKGVRAIANEIEVKLPTSSERPDPDIARAALDALKWNVVVPQEAIQVKVEQGWVKLVGEVDWYFQKEVAEKTVRPLVGVKGVSNLISVKARATPSDVKDRIKDALERGAEFDAEHITVQIDGRRAILRGSVRAFAEKRDAERATRNAPGVSEVDNQLTVDPYAFVTP
jgi:osmotically-inducible protein OsmY